MKPRERLVRLRTRLGEDQRTFAKRLGVSHGAVGHWESERSPIPGPILILLSMIEMELDREVKRENNRGD